MIWFMCIDWKTINCSVGAATQHTFVIKCSLKTLTNYHLTIICHQLQGGKGGGGELWEIRGVALEVVRGGKT